MDYRTLAADLSAVEADAVAFKQRMRTALMDLGGTTYANSLKIEDGLRKVGYFLHPSEWPCPRCAAPRWKDCDCTIQEAYPTQRPPFRT